LDPAAQLQPPEETADVRLHRHGLARAGHEGRLGTASGGDPVPRPRRRVLVVRWPSA